MKPYSTWYANSQQIRILMMSVISGHACISAPPFYANETHATTHDKNISTIPMSPHSPQSTDYT